MFRLTAVIHSVPLMASREDVIVLAMGCTGPLSFAGLAEHSSSSSGSLRETPALKSETSTVKVVRFCDRTSGRNVTIVDTPGFDDSHKDLTDTVVWKVCGKKSLAQFFNEYDNKRKLHGLVYLDRIIDNRLGGQSNINLQKIQQLCGPDAFKNVGKKRELELRKKVFQRVGPKGAILRMKERKIPGRDAITDGGPANGPSCEANVIHRIRCTRWKSRKSTSSLEPLAQRMRLADPEIPPPVVPVLPPGANRPLPTYPEPYRSSEKLKKLKSSAFSSFANPRNHENAWHAPYSELFHELVRPYPSLAPHPQYRLWRLSSERSRATFHRRFPPPSESPSMPDFKADYVPSEPEEEPEDEAFGGGDDDLESEDENNTHALEDGRDEKDPFASLMQNFREAFPLEQSTRTDTRLPVEPTLPSLVAENPDSLDLDLQYILQPKKFEGAQTSAESPSTSAPLFKSTSTVRDRDNQDHVPDIVVIHQEMEDLPEIDQELETWVRFAEEIRRVHRCAQRTVHQCTGLIGEFKRNIPRMAEMQVWEDSTLNVGQKREIVASAIDNALVGARLDLAQYCRLYFKTFPLIEEVIAFAAVGPYWQYAIIQRDDVHSYLPKVRRWPRKDAEIQDRYFKKFTPWKEIGTDESDEGLNEMRDLQLHPLAHDVCF
ncbi:hypothetical protein D9757_011608 [Collybiopsis confluens]|uniref:G domain-containing protein n=1 Tax=Collybiopsis confluens TaxID=2823264 RepID=A0A8H5LWY7_9AGAR|nr:hypothetical protein D9757_011608 [Collybiopsis confluens]